MSCADGPEDRNSRPARPTSFHCSSECELPALSGEVGCGCAGSSSASHSRNELSSTVRAARARTSLAADQNRKIASTAASTLATWGGMKRRNVVASRLVRCRNSRPMMNSAANVTTASAHTSTGRPVSTGSMPMVARTAFCQPGALPQEESRNSHAHQAEQHVGALPHALRRFGQVQIGPQPAPEHAKSVAGSEGDACQNTLVGRRTGYQAGRQGCCEEESAERETYARQRSQEADARRRHAPGSRLR
jgi:hypothetical protein